MTLSPPPLSSQAFFWSMQRGDGIGLALSSHDRSVTVEGVTYRASPGFVPSKVILSDRLLGSSLSMSDRSADQGFDSVSFAESRWRGSSVSLAIGDWTSAVAPVLLCSGEISGMRGEKGSHTVEVDLVPSRLREQPCPHEPGVSGDTRR